MAVRYRGALTLSTIPSKMYAIQENFLKTILINRTMLNFRNLFASVLVALVTSPLAAQQSPSTTVGGYGEIHFTDPSEGSPSADVSRVVLYLAHTFDERLSFRSELEVEHARLEAGGSEGEVALEQAYLDYRFSDRFTLRSGLVLIPIGIQNETHEPPTFNGVERTTVEHDVLPTTWREIGIGALGRFGDAWSYRVYVVNGLKAEGFSADQGIRGGRQEGHLGAALLRPVGHGLLDRGGLGVARGADQHLERAAAVGVALVVVEPRPSAAGEGQGRGRGQAEGGDGTAPEMVLHRVSSR